LQCFKVDYGTGSGGGESGFESEAEITAVLRRLPLTAEKKAVLASMVRVLFDARTHSCVAYDI
jgi:hypothetical protein